MPNAGQSIRSRFVVSVLVLLSLFFLLAVGVHFVQREVQRLVIAATNQHHAAATQLLRFALAVEVDAQGEPGVVTPARADLQMRGSPDLTLAMLDGMLNSPRLGFNADERRRLTEWRRSLSGGPLPQVQGASRADAVEWLPREISLSARRLSERKSLTAAEMVREAEARFQFLDLLLLALCSVAAMVALVLMVMVPPAISRPVDALVRRLDGMLGEQSDDWQQSVQTGVTELNHLSEAVERVRSRYKQLKRDRKE